MLHPEKLRNLMLLIAEHPAVKSLGMTKLWKLIYFVDAASLRETGASITGSEYVKYPFGPVPSRDEKTLKAMRKQRLVKTEQGLAGTFKQTFVEAMAKADKRVFSKEELALIDAVCRGLGGKTATQLSSLSHQEPAWALAQDLQKLDPELMFYGSEEDPEGL